jgi:hypothetical protein
MRREKGLMGSRTGTWMALTAMTAGQVSCSLLLGLDDFRDAPSASAGGGGDGGASSDGNGGASSGAEGCTHGERDCVGDTPRQCADREWIPQRPCSQEAPVCTGGRCVPCSEGERGCAGNRPRRCEGGAWVEEAACAAPFPGVPTGSVRADELPGRRGGRRGDELRSHRRSGLLRGGRGAGGNVLPEQ